MQTEEESTQILPPEGIVDQDGVRRFPDGSVFVEQQQPLIEVKKTDFYANLADFFPENVLWGIGNTLKQDIQEDIDSQKIFYESVARTIELLGINAITAATDQTNLNLYNSTLFEALLDYTTTILSSIYPLKNPVSCVILGEGSQELEDIAKRKAAFFNMYLQLIDKGFDKEIRKIVIWSVITGSIYCKVYIDEILNRPTARMIKPEDFVVNREVSSHLSATRRTQIHHLDKKEFNQRKKTKKYVDINMIATDSEDNVIKDQLDQISGYENTMQNNQNSYTIYESHVDLLIKEDPMNKNSEIPVPYIVTLNAQTGKVLRITRNWEENDPLKQKIEYFVNFSLLPSLDGEGYGLVQVSANQAQAATSITRQLIQSAQYANFPAGFYTGVRTEGTMQIPEPGTFAYIETGGVESIGAALSPLPFKDPTPALFDLKNQIEDSIRRPSAIINSKIMDMAPNAPMGTVLALLESENKIPNFIVQGYHQSFQNLLELLNKRLFEWLPENQPYPFMVPGGQHVIMKADFSSDIQVIPSEDPRQQNSTYRLIRSELILNNATKNPQDHNVRNVFEYFYKNLGMSQSEIDMILTPKPDDKKIEPLNPITENQNLIIGKPVAVGLEQDHDAHMIVHKQLLNDPNIAQDPNIAPTISSHIREHLAAKVLINFQEQTGFIIPEDPTQIPMELQNQIAVEAAKLTQPQEGQEAPEDPNLIAAKAEMVIAQTGQQELQLKSQKLEIEAQKEQEKNQIEAQKLQLEEKRLQFDMLKFKTETGLKSRKQNVEEEINTVKSSLDTEEKELDIMIKSQEFAEKVQQDYPLGQTEQDYSGQ